MSLNLSNIDQIGIYTEEDIINLLEKVLSDSKFAKAILEGKDPCKIEKVKQRSISPLHKYIFLYSLFDDVFGHKQKVLYKRDKELNLLTKEDIITYLLQKDIFKKEKDKLEKAITNVLKYENLIRKNKDNFIFTYYQFFALLFTELFFLFQDIIEDKLKLILEKNYSLIKEIFAIKKEELEGISKADLEEIFVLLKKRKDKNKLKLLEEKLHSQNNLIKAIKEIFKISIVEFETFVNKPLNKLAYYMATGSGKTHILHINLLQAKEYLKNIQKVFLIVPNNDLALQHKINLEEFGFKNIAYIEDTDNTLSKEVENLILEYNQEDYDLVILTVHQLNSFMKRYKEKEIGEFGDNLVFVDEGHKGDIDGWRNDRNKLAGKNGFIFEYSATFAQAIKDNEELIREYSKSIIYYYPYHYFYNDGYGKTPVFYPQNLVTDILENKKIKDDSQKNYELFIQNILSHYKQLDYYLKHKNNLEFIERFKLPLSMFVAYRISSDKNSTTKKSNKKSTNIKSDVYQLYEWLERFIKNQKNETIKYISKYKKNFHIQENEQDIFNNIIIKCFNGKIGDNNIRVWELNNNEIAFSLSSPKEAFAVVYIGDVNSITEFNGIKEPSNLVNSIIEDFLKDPDNYNLQFLIVGRKLIEGFDTVRINNLSLLNIGKTEGSLVVQLFGRGVRLKGNAKEPLKRENIHPIMERINIFGYNANFLKKFIEETEVLEVLEEEEYFIKIQVDNSLLRNKKIPTIETRLEESNKYFNIGKSKEIKNKIFKKYSNVISNDKDGIYLGSLLNFNYLYKNLINIDKYKNLLFSYDNVKEIYKFLFDNNFILNTKINNLKSLNDLALIIFDEYISNIYKKIQRDFEKNNITLKTLDAKHKNLDFTYSIRVPSQSLLNEELKKISKDRQINITFKSAEDKCFESMYLETSNNRELFAIKVDNHIYKPLICKINNFNISISPDRLEESEVNFLNNFCRFVKTNPNKNLVILRNLKSGIGFDGFYPDFIMWYIEEKENIQIEHIIFLDPKGMTAHNVREVLEKSKLSLRLKKLEEELHKNNSFKNVKLHSFILLNQPLENYLSNDEIRDSINNFFAEETMGKLEELSNNDIQDLMNIYNIFYLEENKDLIDKIINKLDESILEKLSLKTEELKNFYLKDFKIKKFLEKWQKESYKKLQKEYDLCNGILSKEEALISFLIKHLLGEQMEIEYCQELKTFVKFDKLKTIGKEEVFDYIIEKMFPEIINKIPIAGFFLKETIKYVQRNKEDLKSKFLKA